MKHLFITLLFLTSFCTISQNTSLKFVVPNAKGNYLYLVKYSDYITEMQEVVFESVIPKDEIVNIELHLAETNLFFVYVNFAEAMLYVSPNTSYTISISLPKEGIQIANPFQKKQYLNLSIQSSQPGDVNKKISDFNVLYDKFIVDKMYSKSADILNEHEKFKTNFLNSLSDKNDVFFNTFLEYTFALTEVSFKKQINQDFIDKYFTNRNIPYNSYEYFLLLKEVGKQNISISKSEPFGELLSLYSIQRRYIESAGYVVSDVNNNISNFISSTDNVEVKQIALNVKKMLTRYSAGMYMDSFELVDAYGNDFNPYSLNKNLFFFFFNSDVDICKELISQYKDIEWELYNTVPLMISTDLSLNNSVNTYPFIQLKPKKLFSNLYDLNIKNFPFAILTNYKGIIKKYNAPVMKGNLEQLLISAGD